MKQVYLLDLICSISSTLDYVSTTVTGHHRRVSISSIALGAELGLNRNDLTDLFIAALLHDIGAFSTNLKFNGLDFDADLTEHADIGYRLLKGHPIFDRASQIVRYHHTPWAKLADYSHDENISFMANILSLADRIDALGHVGIKLVDKKRIREVVGAYPKTLYTPRAVEAFMALSTHDTFWEHIEQEEVKAHKAVETHIDNKHIPEDQLIDFSLFFAHIIDFRSRHTATHSQGVAETAVQLAKLCGMSESDQQRMRLAGNLHDIGKLAVPVALLDKPAALTDDEYRKVQFHVEVCENVLRSIPGLEDITDWACQHHERINGKGYPHGLKNEEISLGSRIMAVADVFTAITEDRPYRVGMTPDKAHRVLISMMKSGFLDQEIVTLLIDNFDEIDAVRRIVQTRAKADFKHFRDA